MTDYPEHAKLRAIVDRSQVVGEFVRWLDDEKGIHLREYAGHELYPVRSPLRDLLAEFFGIDQRKLEAEKDAMLDEQRALNGETRDADDSRTGAVRE